MGLEVSKRLLDSTMVMELKGRITLGEGSRILRDAVREVIAVDRPKAFILDMSGVKYVDSSGIGELVSTFSTVQSSLGYRLFLCHPRIKTLDLLLITKLATVFRMVATVETALSGVESEQLLFICPADTCESWSLLQPDVEYQVCTRCKSEYRLNVDESGRPDASIGHVLMSSYPGCSVSFTPGKVPTITLTGPVDLYVTNILDRAWRTMQWSDRMGIFDLTTATEITEKAVWRLLKIARNSQEAEAGFIVLPPSHPLASINDPKVYADLKKAHHAFGEDRGVGVTTRFLH
jgi:anti-sigma B factor antagonist